MVRGRNGFNDRPEVTAFRSAVRSVALSHLLQPLNTSGNCEADSDSLLVDVLQSATAVRKQGCTSSLRAAAKTAATRLESGTSLAEPEVVSEDEGDLFSSDDEEVIEDDDNAARISKCEEEVVDMLGGYVITRLQRQGKLQCKDCVKQLLQNRRSILLQEREYVECTRQALFSSSTDLRAFLLHTEEEFRRVVQGVSTLMGLAPRSAWKRSGLHQSCDAAIPKKRRPLSSNCICGFDFITRAD